VLPIVQQGKTKIKGFETSFKWRSTPCAGGVLLGWEELGVQLVLNPCASFFTFSVLLRGSPVLFGVTAGAAIMMQLINSKHLL
jgi:hypothetical protein